MEAKDLYNYFSSSVKKSGHFSGWKKSGAKKFICEDDNLVKTIEIEQMKSLGPNSHHLSLTLAVFVHSDILPIRDIYGRKRKKGTLLFQWSARSGKGFGAPTVGSDRTWKIKSDLDIENYKSEIETTISEDMPKYLSLIETPKKLLEFVKKNENLNQYLPLLLELHGKEEAKKELLNYFSSAPEPRPQEQIFDWAVKYEVLPKGVVSELKKASIQHLDTYSKRMREICAEIA